MWSDCLRGSADNELKIMSHQRIITYLISPNFLLMTAPTVEKADVVFSEAVLTTALVFWYLQNTEKSHRMLRNESEMTALRDVAQLNG